MPARYAALFADHAALLASHHGYDIGSLVLARELARTCDAPLIAASTTRLLVDLNRSLGHPRLWSPITRTLPPSVRAEVLAEHYRPYRSTVEAMVRSLISQGRRVVHVSAHSFTAELDGVERRADIGLLYDPRRRWERAVCNAWQYAFEERTPHLDVRRNYPYRGTADGLTTALRRGFPATRYAGIELEINQRHPLGRAGSWRRLRRQVIAALRIALGQQAEGGAPTNP